MTLDEFKYWFKNIEEAEYLTAQDKFEDIKDLIFRFINSEQKHKCFVCGNETLTECGCELLGQ